MMGRYKSPSRYLIAQKYLEGHLHRNGLVEISLGCEHILCFGLQRKLVRIILATYSPPNLSKKVVVAILHNRMRKVQR
jgi:hypothetical protein